MNRILYWKSCHDMTAFAEACFRLTPKVYAPGGAGAAEVYLDIAATERVFGGEARQLLAAETLAETLLTSPGNAVLTDRPEWARAFAEEVPGRHVWLPPGKSAAALAALPVERLVFVGDPVRLAEERSEREALVLFLRRVGMKTIGDFARLPMPAIGQRFGQAGAVLKEWVAGKRELKLAPFVPEESIRERIDADELPSLDALLFVLRQTLTRLEARLAGRARAAKRLSFDFYFESTAPRKEAVELAEPMREAEAMFRVLREFFAKLTWASPLVRLEIEVSDTMLHQAAQLSLLDEVENRFHDLAGYVARLRARYSAESVGFAALRDSHLPERAWETVWPPEAPPPRRQRFPERPLFLFHPPRPCPPPKRSELIATENIVAEWWEPGGNRRYFVAKSPRTGECLWVYWDAGKDEWFVHGTFD